MNKHLLIIRALDILFSLLGLVLLSPLLVLIYIILLFKEGKPLFYQERVGLNKCPFTLVKFRTMPIGTPSVASHALNNTVITKTGDFLRCKKLDELPQLWNVLVGDMSLVGPRPCLFNQAELLDYRDANNVFSVRPGVTGLAQIKKVDMSTPKLLANIDKKMIDTMSISNYFKYILLTMRGKGQGDAVLK